MKTTVEISDALFEQARRAAARERSTLRALIEEGLRQVLRQRGRRRPFTLRRASFKGQGLQPGAATGGWERVRDTMYEGRGA